MCPLIVNEMFAGIQGETAYQGLVCYFIRLTGCNLRCKFCDTAYAFEEGREYEISNIIREVKNSNVNLVSVTGGEPLYQPESYKLIDELITNNFKVTVETNGSYLINKINRKAAVIMDIKTPASGSFKKMKLENFGYLKSKDEIKMVIMNRKDYLWAAGFCEGHDLFHKLQISFQPAYPSCSPRSLAEWILEDRLPVRFRLQVHKILWDEARGR